MAFISQEAREKAREIQVKADEEFAIEKVSQSLAPSRLVDALANIIGKDRPIRVTAHRSAIREEAEAGRDWMEDVRLAKQSGKVNADGILALSLPH